MHKNRPLCRCRKQPVAINYYKEGVPYYRSICDKCRRKESKKNRMPDWQRQGYKLKAKCERCGFTHEHPSQLTIFHIDRDMTNNSWRNLRTVCLNCHSFLYATGSKWKQGDLVPDF